MNSVPLLQTFDTSKSIEELELIVWAPLTLQSYVARTCFELRRKPLRDLTNEELRVGLEQQVGVEYLVLLAIEQLKSDSLLEARLYGGDLLQSLLDVPFNYWLRNPELQRKAGCIAMTAMHQAVNCPVSWRSEVLPGLCDAYDRFTGKLASRSWLRSEEGKTPPS